MCGSVCLDDICLEVLDWWHSGRLRAFWGGYLWWGVELGGVPVEAEVFGAHG